MTQLVLGGELLPEVSRDEYSCWEENLSVQVDMISGRRVEEVRGRVWKIKYSYDYMGREELRRVLKVLRGGGPIWCTFLPDESDETQASWFWVESMTAPTMAFSRRVGDEEAAFWHNISFVLREERPHL